MGEVEAKKDGVTRHEFRHDRHTVSLLTDHLVFSPKYRGKVLLGEVAEAAEEIVIDEKKEEALKMMQMIHCRQCRADAIGKLGKDIQERMFSKNRKNFKD
jgi:Transposase and inactivated derivatives